MTTSDRPYVGPDEADAVDRLRADYDTTPYVSDAFAQSAPGQLAATAHLFGLEAPEVATARVLEIGCATGGNSIPFAVAHPRARVVGIDLSAVQIDNGRSLVTALGLDNLELIAGDIASMDLSGETGPVVMPQCTATCHAVGEGHDLVHEHEEDFGGND